MNMGSGHFGSSARYDVVRERANEYAVCIKQWEKMGYDVSLRVDYPDKTPADKKRKRNKLKK